MDFSKLPKATDDYSHGQMMGMLVVVMMLEAARENKVPFPASRLDKIKQIAANDLSGFFEKPAEDVLLLVEEMIKTA